MQTRPQYQAPRLTTEQVEREVRWASTGNCLDIMMHFAENRESFERLPHEAQKRIFLNLAERDPYETLNLRSLYIDKPFAKDILEKAALEYPEHGVTLVMDHPDDPKFQALHRFLIQKFGRDVVEREMKANEGFFTRIEVYGVLRGLFGVHSMGKPKMKEATR